MLRSLRCLRVLGRGSDEGELQEQESLHEPEQPGRRLWKHFVAFSLFFFSFENILV